MRRRLLDVARAGLGRTIAFSDRAAACAHFKLPQHVCKGWGIPLGRVFPEGRFELAALLGLRHAARAAGYDSVQYVSAPGFNYEIQDLRDGEGCLLYTSPSPRDGLLSRMPSSA